MIFGMIFSDSKKEYNDEARIGYGLDGDDAARVADFEAVRGTAETNKVVRKIEAELDSIKQRTDELRGKLKRLGS